MKLCIFSREQQGCMRLQCQSSYLRARNFLVQDHTNDRHNQLLSHFISSSFQGILFDGPLNPTIQGACHCIRISRVLGNTNTIWTQCIWQPNVLFSSSLGTRTIRCIHEGLKRIWYRIRDCDSYCLVSPLSNPRVVESDVQRTLNI